MTAEPVPVGSRAVLIGVSAYEYAEFPPIRAARNSVQAMRSLLSDPALCAWPPEQITVIANPISATELAAAVADQAERTTGVLLVYYVGHGVLSPGGELCLTVTSTRPDRPKITGLPWDTVADVLRGCPACTRVAILDCCVAGQAVEALTPDGDNGLADIAHVDGVYTLTATTGNRAAHVAPPGQQDTACTSFTGELRDLIQQGIPGKAPRLTLSDIYPVLRQRLRGKGLPAPNQRGIDAASRFLFTSNAANAAAGTGPRAPGTAGERPGPLTLPPQNVPDVPPPVPDGPPPEPGAPPGRQQSGVVTDALRAAHSITDDSAKAPALAAVAGAVATTDPGRARRLIADAQRIAESVPDPAARAAALVAVVDNLAAIDASGAVRLAQAIPDPVSKAPALAAAAAGLAATGRGRAGPLIAESEDLARAIPGPAKKASALAAVAERLAPADADRAERVAHSVPDPGLRAPALAAIAEALTATDSDRAARLTADAERLALSIPGTSLRAPALAAVARALSGIDPRRAAALIADAEHLAQAIPGAAQKASALAAVAAGLAPADTERAQRLAQSIVGAASRASALAAVAKSAAVTGADRAGG